MRYLFLIVSLFSLAAAAADGPLRERAFDYGVQTLGLPDYFANPFADAVMEQGADAETYFSFYQSAFDFARQDGKMESGEARIFANYVLSRSDWKEGLLQPAAHFRKIITPAQAKAAPPPAAAAAKRAPLFMPQRIALQNFAARCKSPRQFANQVHRALFGKVVVVSLLYVWYSKTMNDHATEEARHLSLVAQNFYTFAVKSEGEGGTNIKETRAIVLAKEVDRHTLTFEQFPVLQTTFKNARESKPTGLGMPNMAALKYSIALAKTGDPDLFAARYLRLTGFATKGFAEGGLRMTDKNEIWSFAEKFAPTEFDLPQLMAAQPAYLYAYTNVPATSETERRNDALLFLEEARSRKDPEEFVQYHRIALQQTTEGSPKERWETAMRKVRERVTN